MGAGGTVNDLINADAVILAKVFSQYRVHCYLFMRNQFCHADFQHESCDIVLSYLLSKLCAAETRSTNYADKFCLPQKCNGGASCRHHGSVPRLCTFREAVNIFPGVAEGCLLRVY